MFVSLVTVTVLADVADDALPTKEAFKVANSLDAHEPTTSSPRETKFADQFCPVSIEKDPFE